MQYKRYLQKMVLGMAVACCIVMGTSYPSKADTHTAATINSEAEYVEDEVIIVYQDGISEKKANSVAERQLGVEKNEIIETPQDEVVSVAELPKGTTVEEAVKEYAGHSAVEYVQPNYIYTLPKQDTVSTQSTQDTYRSKQWYLDAVHAETAWTYLEQYAAKRAKIKVAVIDTGIDIGHPDLVVSKEETQRDNVDVLNSWNVISGSVLQGDAGDHGTHVTGIIGAIGNNGKGIAGTASGSGNGFVDIIGINVFQCNEENKLIAYTNDLVTGINHAMKQGAKVINMSLGTYENDLAMESAITEAIHQKITVVAAAGNDGTDQSMYPASYPNVIGVVSTAVNGKKANSSNYGINATLSAPGEYIYSTVPTSTNGIGYTYHSGTSMAAPVVSSVAAMLYYVNPNFTPAQITYFLTSTADNLGSSHLYGSGLVNASGAVAKALGQQDSTHAAIDRAPSGFKVSNTGYNTLTLSWQAVSGVTGYRIERSTSAKGKFSHVATIKSSYNSWKNTGLKTGTRYYYRVYAIYYGSQGTQYSSANGKPTLAKSKIKKISKKGSRSLKVYWSKVHGASGYVIYRSTKKNSGYKKVKTITKGSTTSYTNTKLRRGRRYYYKVRAYRKVSGKKIYSSYSNIKNRKR